MYLQMYVHMSVLCAYMCHYFHFCITSVYNHPYQASKSNLLHKRNELCKINLLCVSYDIMVCVNQIV